ncbi:methionine--tRNA ligase [bacterium]|nr:methionine--tRNA ligase [bacterium]MBT4251075.1 methionine--tRNA ligase [bacterium]MBT4597917.1 methionine--tRNA ligase [bacterium]MBT6753891.1 methionine--tRNA ligase [bacterium]MBT7037321.1 methionine--tRNA ligase [bacterium]
MKNTYYITTTLPYVNAKPHIGFALEIVSADVLARANKLFGKEVFFNTGTDEHGLKILRKAEELGVSAQEYCNAQAKNFKSLRDLLNVEFDRFIRTTDADHKEAAQKFWKICDENGFIYKKNYKANYCVGCELEKTNSELVDGKCPDHPNAEIEIIEEENYFFKFSEFGERLLKMYKDNPDFVKPKKRFNEIISFVEQGLQDFSISRLKEKMPCGVEVPGDEKHVMYVWFDALVNYISTLGWPNEEENFKKWWPGVQFCGKDNLRQQSAMWQAMLMAANLPCSKKVYVNGFINIDGQKMSKSLGNVISPEEMVQRYGVDATRYLLLSMGSFGEDADINWARLDEKFNADLANGIGNLTSRVITLYKKAEFDLDFEKSKRKPFVDNIELEKSLDEGRFGDEITRIMKLVQELDRSIEQQKPWELIENEPEAFRESIEGLARGVYFIGLKLKPFMPETSESIVNSLEEKNKVKLFPRL